jgi:hypothetical protein
VRAGGGRFFGRFLGRFECNHRTPWLHQLHLAGTLVAPRSSRGVKAVHPAGPVIHSFAAVQPGVQRLHFARLLVTGQPRGARPGSARQLVLRRGRAGFVQVLAH